MFRLYILYIYIFSSKFGSCWSVSLYKSVFRVWCSRLCSVTHTELFCRANVPSVSGRLSAAGVLQCCQHPEDAQNTVNTESRGQNLSTEVRCHTAPDVCETFGSVALKKAEGTGRGTGFWLLLWYWNGVDVKLYLGLCGSLSRGSWGHFGALWRSMTRGTNWSHVCW